MNYTVRLTPELYDKVRAIATREERSLNDTARLLIGSGLVRVRKRGVLLDQAASAPGELVLFPLRLESQRSGS